MADEVRRQNHLRESSSSHVCSPGCPGYRTQAGDEKTETEKLREIVKDLIDNGCGPGCSHEGDKDQNSKMYWDAVDAAKDLGIAIDDE